MTSSEFNQNVAFGILRDKDVDGTPLIMPKMIRTRSTSELINLCRLYLAELNLECPSDRIMYTYVENMPAGSQKIMVGVNPYWESCMSSFHDLREIVTKTVPFVGNHTGKVLMSGIATAETYIRYRQNLLLG